MLSININGHQMEVPEGITVLEAINSSGTYISQLCKDPDMKPIGACRTCLVKIDGVNGYPASCSTPVNDGMQIWTETPDVRNTRSGVLDLTLSMLLQDNQNNNSSKNIEKDYQELSTALKHHGIKDSRWKSRKRHKTDDSNPVFDIAMSDCILCGRCVQACQDGHQFIGAIDFLGTSTDSRIGTFMDSPLIDSVCTTCGQCLSVCPTGAISVKVEEKPTVKEIDTTCPYCGVGCGITTQVDSDQQITAMQDNPLNQSSKGMLCVKGRFGFKYVHHKDRLKQPLIRKNGILTESSWEEAIEYVGNKLSLYRGSEFATLCSAKATNEDGYIQQKFARTVMATNNIDHCTRLCHSP
ncbi:MAG: formate dehydrogenase subunit alpha, partial [Dehalococcoidia bacterium]|nr:formate dehydrogenase subunit alpha [Dehalococcoidia bacterium]